MCADGETCGETGAWDAQGRVHGRERERGGERVGEGEIVRGR